MEVPVFQFQWKRLCKNKAILISFFLYIVYVSYLVKINYNPYYPIMLIDTIMMQILFCILCFDKVKQH